MKVRIVKRTSLVPLPIAEAFQIFSDPRSVELLTPSTMRFRLMNAVSEPIKPGAILDYQFNFYRIPIRWRLRIESIEPPNSFVDVQETGPFAHWRHSQTFSASGAKATELRDRFEFGLPFGRVGEFAYQMFVKEKIRSLLDQRANKIDLLMRRKAPRPAGERIHPEPSRQPMP